MLGMKLFKGKFTMMAGVCLMLALAGGSMNAQAQPPTNLIPAPVEYSVSSGSINSNKMASLREKVRISEKALLRRMEGRKLADGQLKSAYLLESG